MHLAASLSDASAVSASLTLIYVSVRTTATGEAVEPQAEQGVSEVPAVRKPSKEATWLGPKESAVRQHRQEMKAKMKTNKVEEVKPTRPKQVRNTGRVLMKTLLENCTVAWPPPRTLFSFYV